jgi:cytochrome P450
VIEELDAQNLSIDRRVPTVEELQACEYLSAFIWESFRFKPTVPVNQRVNLYEDIEVGGVRVEKGTNINIPMIVVFRDPDTFPEPDVFKPDRFMGESDSARKQKGAVMPFGSYNRICVGMNLAKVEVRAILAAVLRQNTVRFFNHKEPTTSDIEAGANMPTAKMIRFVFSSR